MNGILGRLESLVLTSGARPLRFAGTGVTAGAVQLAILAGLTHDGWRGLPANAVAFLLAAQLNFALSTLFTWRDRKCTGSLGRRWLLFHGSITFSALLNLTVFTLLGSVLPPLAASAAGIAAGAMGNYVAGDRLVFRRERTIPAPERIRAA